MCPTVARLRRLTTPVTVSIIPQILTFTGVIMLTEEHQLQLARLHDLVNGALHNVLAICPDRRLPAATRREHYKWAREQLEAAEAALRFLTGRYDS